MDFSELKTRIKKEIQIDEPEFVNESNDLLAIGHLELTSTQKLVFSISDFRGKKYFDIRTWYQDDTGAWRPTKKGIHFSFDRFKDFEDHIQKFLKITEMDQ